jgi:hypothetical protein
MKKREMKVRLARSNARLQETHEISSRQKQQQAEAASSSAKAQGS